jgi:hypothetical protein
MTKRPWRDLVASPDRGLWQGAIPRAPTSPQGRKENLFSDVVMRLAKMEGDKEKLGELLANAVERGQVRVKLTDEKPERRGRKPNGSADANMLQDIRAKNPKSDEWTKFKNRLTVPALGRLPVSVDTARRRYKKSVALLDQK